MNLGRKRALGWRPLLVGWRSWPVGTKSITVAIVACST